MEAKNQKPSCKVYLNNYYLPVEKNVSLDTEKYERSVYVNLCDKPLQISTFRCQMK